MTIRTSLWIVVPFVLLFLQNCSRVEQARSQETAQTPLLDVPAVSWQHYLDKNNKSIAGGWQAKRADEVDVDGTVITAPGYDLAGWMRAVVPGTVLTTLVGAGVYPDPYFGLNNTTIPDISEAGLEAYTYWFFKDVNLTSADPERRVWLQFRGINYAADIFLNGRRVNSDTHRGMFLRKLFDVTERVRFDGSNKLAVLVKPPDPAGTPGGQGGDGVIARNVTMQCTPGWDWMMPIADRNTGIWDQVSLTFSGPVVIRDPYVVTRVPGRREPGGEQEAAFITVSADLYNATKHPQAITFIYQLDGITGAQAVQLQPGETRTVTVEKIVVDNPQLWWPNGYGEQPLYDLQLIVDQEGKGISDLRNVRFGIREVTSAMDPDAEGRIFRINGQKVFIRGGNWIASDAMLRLTPERYDHEVRMHAEMNLNAIRVWGGSITERPEFYEACDQYGILVMQDFWVTGDCNGTWFDPRKKESQERRRAYPDDHSLFLASVEDQVKMLRNHPSLLFYTGGNEWPPPADINEQIAKEIIPALDGRRLYVSHSTSDSLSINRIGGTGDGPYRIQPPAIFFTRRSFPFNSEIGSVGVPVVETLRAIMEEKDLVLPRGQEVNPVWRYHKYSGYMDRTGTDHIDLYGAPQDLEAFATQAQLANYMQYKALIEGWNAHMWDWYTGVFLWKSQNPWTGLRGQLYDWFLDQTGGFYGLKHAAEPVHVQLNLATMQVDVVNTTAAAFEDVEVSATVYDLDGQAFPAGAQHLVVEANRTHHLFALEIPEAVGEVYFARLTLDNQEGARLSENFYWLRKPASDYTALHDLDTLRLDAAATYALDDDRYRLTLTVTNENSPVAFWIRVQLLDPGSGERVLPVFYEDNYFSLVPGEHKTIDIDFSADAMDSGMLPALWLEGWNVARHTVTLEKE